MATKIKDQGLAVSFVCEEGLGGLRFWNGKLQVWDEDKKAWVDLLA